MAALKLLQRVEELNYLILECLAERTLADRYQIMVSGGDGYDSHSRFFAFDIEAISSGVLPAIAFF